MFWQIQELPMGRFKVIEICTDTKFETLFGRRKAKIYDSPLHRDVEGEFCVFRAGDGAKFIRRASPFFLARLPCNPF